MKITIETLALCDTLKTVAAAADTSNPTLPILSHVLIDVRETAEFSATNLELYCKHTPNAEVIRKGAIVAPLELLSRLSSRIQASKTTLEQIGEKLVVRGGEVIATLPTLPAAEFPATIEQAGHSVSLEVSELIKPFRKLSHAMSTDHSRYTLMGVNVEPKESGSELAASNGTKLVVHQLPQKLSDEDIILPDIFVRAFLKLQLSGVGVAITGNGSVTVANSTTRLSAKLIEGKYPNYRQIVPKNGDNVFSCRRDALMSAIGTCALFTERDFPALKLRGCGKEIEVSKPDAARARVLGTELLGQPDFEIAFNSRHMLDTLSTLDGEEVRIACSTPQNPMRIQEGPLTAVLVPVTTKEV